ncbi:MAG: hypothetical protein HC859_14425 [Bacteroidia bacterium]|nr:hypothetical protein [Bacteroidia bacterium]
METLSDAGHVSFKYHGNMMDWPGWQRRPPFTGLMIQTDEDEKTAAFKNFRAQNKLRGCATTA